jgi:regulator of sigma E protease
MDFFIKAIIVVLEFGLIVFIHEWGHMMAAKRCKVSVPTFAIGMGPSLFSFQLGETRYHLCAFPLGGFVKIEGLVDDGHIPEKQPSEMEFDPVDTDRSAELQVETTSVSEAQPEKSAVKRWNDINGWQKSFILVSGPMMNIFAALVTIFIMGQIGFQVNDVMISGVEDNMPAKEAGLQAGDIVHSVNGSPIENSQQFIFAVQHSGGQPVRIGINRIGEQLELSATPRNRDNFNEGKLSLGVVLQEVMRSTNAISLVPARSSGYSAGLRVGDKIVAMDGKPVSNGLDVLLAMAPFNPTTYDPEDYYGHALDEQGYPLNEDGQRLGISEDGFLLGSDGEKLLSEHSGEAMEAQVFGAINLTVERGTEQLQITLPAATSMISAGMNFKSDLLRLPFKRAMVRSLEEAKYSLLGIVDGMRALFTKEGARSVSGPIGIFVLIGQSASSDIYTFLMMFMVININLGILNLLPFPLLDGGRLVFVALKGIGVKITEHSEATVHFIGSLILIGFILYVSFFDVAALIPRGGG